MEYEQRSFVWRDVPSVEVDFDGAITRDGARVDVPPLLVRR
jgi:hypothetical protein